VLLCSVAVGYLYCRGPCCLFNLAMEAARSSKTLHGVTTQKTLTWIFSAVKTLDLTLGWLCFPSGTECVFSDVSNQFNVILLLNVVVTSTHEMGADVLQW